MCSQLATTRVSFSYCNYYKNFGFTHTPCPLAYKLLKGKGSITNSYCTTHILFS